MAVLSAPAPARTAAAVPGAAGVRLSAVACAVFRDRREPLIGGDRTLALETLETYGRTDEYDAFISRFGNSFITMSEDLLARVGTPPPPADAVFLAYQTPDLYSWDVAGCYLTRRFAGSPVPLSVAEQGPGAAYTALRVADGMCRLGELRRGALFAYDQNAAVWDADEQVQRLPDSAVLLLLGADGPVRVEQWADHEIDDPAAAVAEALGRNPQARALLGAALTQEVGALAAHPRITRASPEHRFTGAWMSLAAAWPLAGPVLLADYDAETGRFYSCLLDPEDRP